MSSADRRPRRNEYTILDSDGHCDPVDGYCDGEYTHANSIGDRNHRSSRHSHGNTLSYAKTDTRTDLDATAY